MDKENPQINKMKSKIYKCDFGYYESQYKKEIIKTVILFATSLIILGIGMYITWSKDHSISFTQSKYNLLTIAAVLGLLPASRFLINVIMFARAKKYACPKTLYDLFHPYESDKMILRYDLYVTAYDKCFPIKSITMCDDCLIGYTDFKEFDHGKFATHVKTLLSQNSLKVGTIKIFTEKEKYIERIQNYHNNGYEQTDKDLSVLKLMENISL